MQIHLRASGLLAEIIDMMSFFWNVREFNKTLKHSIVKELISNKEMIFGCILETKVKENKSVKILNFAFCNWSHMANYECSVGGRIWLFWRDSVHISPVFKTDNLSLYLLRFMMKKYFFSSFIYAKNQVEERKDLWEDICHHKDSHMFQNKA